MSAMICGASGLIATFAVRGLTARTVAQRAAEYERGMEVPYQFATPPPFAVDELRAGSRLVLVAAGEIDMATAHALWDALERADVSGVDEVWVDLSAVEFMDSNGVHALVDRRRPLVVICPDGPVRRVLSLTGIDREVAVVGPPS